MNIKRIIKDYLIERHALNAKGIDLQYDTHLLKHRIIDSIGVIELIIFLNKYFNMEIGDENITMENFQTIEHLSTLVDSILCENG